MRFTISILIVVAATSTSQSLAQEVKGAPNALIGKFGNSPAQCQSYNRKNDNITHITKDYLSFCNGSACEARIISHRIIKDGFVIKLVSDGNPDGWTETVTRIDSGIYEFRSQIYQQKNVETLVRCTIKDAIVGIGLSTQPHVNETIGVQASDLAFSTYYAAVVPKACPGTRVDHEAVQKALDKAKRLWIDHDTEYKKQHPGSMFSFTLESFLKSQEREAVVAVKADLEEISKFCTEVIDAFGPKGRVLPGMISDTRKKA